MAEDGPFPAPAVDGPGGPTEPGGPVGAVLVGAGPVGTVLVGTVVVGASVVVVPEPLVARTELGGKVGCPSGPMSVDPNVQASTLPGGGW